MFGVTMFLIKTTDMNNNVIDYVTFETKSGALDWLDDNGYERDVINTGEHIKEPPDVFWSSYLQRKAVLREINC